MEFARDFSLTAHWLGLVVVLTFVFLVAGLVLSSRLPKAIKVLFCVALVLRVVGALVRYKVLFLVYDGSGDALVYFNRGIRIGELFRQLDFSPIWAATDITGTTFVALFSGGVLAIIGPSLFAEYIVFSLLAFVGLLGFGVAFHRAYPAAPVSRCLLWIWLFPSLWFWPSSVGKEALILCGLGIAVMGFIGRGRINWFVLSLGLLLIFVTRPQVTVILLVSVLVAQWLSFGGRWTTGRIVQGVFLLVVGVIGLSISMRTIGIQEFDVEGVKKYVEQDKGREAEGSSSVDPVGTQLSGLPVAAANILFRPFIWEARKGVLLLSSLEILAMWAIVFKRRHALLNSLRNWRHDRFLRLAVVFILLYSVALGMMLINLGIIARQRIFLFPFVFLLIEASPALLDRARARTGSGGRSGSLSLANRRRVSARRTNEPVAGSGVYHIQGTAGAPSSTGSLSPRRPTPPSTPV